MQKTLTVDKQGSKTLKVEFKDYADFLAYAAPESPTMSNSSRREEKRERRGGMPWAGTENFEQAMDLAEKGWPDGLAMIESLTAQIEKYSGSYVKKPEIQWDVAGDFADAGLFVTGVPECMGFFTETIAPGAGKVLRILANLSTSCGVSTDAMMRRGAAAVALADALENAGRSCEIIVATDQRYNGDTLINLVPVKRAGEAIELDRLAFILAHPASYRRLFFSSWEQEDKSWRDSIGIYGCGGYGMPCNYEAKEGEFDITMPCMSLYQQRDDAAILQWIKEELVRQGCEVEGEDKVEI